jgi:hypothetical protein
MRIIIATFVILCMLSSIGCGRLNRRHNDGEYSGFPNTLHDKFKYNNTSLCKTTDDILYSKPCTMTIVVSEDFNKGYYDGIKDKKIKIFGKNEEYQAGHDLGEKDRSNNSVRKFEIKR